MHTSGTHQPVQIEGGKKIWQAILLNLLRKGSQDMCVCCEVGFPSFSLWEVLLWVETSQFCGCPVTRLSINLGLYKSAGFVLVIMSVFWGLLVRIHPGNEYCAHDLWFGRSGSNARQCINS